ncbi:MAG: ABC transporter substrate-binding protein [Deltaproteobacteria bacterium]|nr:ABC transporter substrate-binding protein [Deltaproteobacteria bacterium]MDZ4341873.1 ABC transporter substrate-binding protein [Candidatus Binatia bacterium]
MTLVHLNVMYGHLEGTERKFARDPSGYLSIEAGIYQRHGLEISWNHVQGTEERYRRLESGEAQISFVVGRASLQHFLDTYSTRVLGCVMNSCPYYLVADAAVGELRELKGKTVACREGPARGVPFARVFQEYAGIKLDGEVTLKLPKSDQETFHLLIGGQVAAALLPRPYGFMAEEKGFKRIAAWPDVVDDPLPITIETTAALAKERRDEFRAFFEAHREGVRYINANRNEAIKLLAGKFGHSPALAARTVEEYLVCMDESLAVDFKQFERLLSQVAPEKSSNARQIASEWIVTGALRG